MKRIQDIKESICKTFQSSFPLGKVGMGALLLLAISSCKDYTEDNFGSDDVLSPSTETGTFSLSLGSGDYTTVATNAANLQKALELGYDTVYATREDGSTDSSTIKNITVDSLYLKALKNVDTDKCLNDKTPAELFLPVWVDSKLPWATDGATALVTVKEDTVAFNLCSLFSGAVTKGKYMIVPAGTDTCLQSTQEEGSAYITGTPVNRFDGQSLKYQTSYDELALTIVPENDHYLIYNNAGAYLCTEDGSDKIAFYEDLGDLDEGEQAWWTVKKQSDHTYTLTNNYSGQQLYWNKANQNASLYQSKSDELVGLTLYSLPQSNGAKKVGKKEGVTKTLYTFVKSNGQWQIKDSYFSHILTGATNKDAATIHDVTGFSIVVVDMPSTLTYVWSQQSSYGLKASAYANSTKNVTESWAISPEVDLTNGAKPVVVFDHAQKYAGDVKTELTVWATSDAIDESKDIDPEEYKWTQLPISDSDYPDGTSWTYQTVKLDLSQFNGCSHVRVAFKYISTSSYAATWEVKNFSIKEDK